MEAQMLSELRERCVLLVRDAAKLLAYIKDAPVRLQNGLRDAQRCLRRKPTKDGLEALMGACKQLVTSLRRIVETENPSGNGVQNERHKQCQKPDYFDSEKAMITKPNRAVPLPFILKACPEITKYATGPIQNWASMIHQATYIKTLIGISEDAWSDACLRIGACEAATILAYMLERLSKIQNPGGYLRVLTKEAERDGLCLNLMIASLLNQGKQSTAGVES
jgi:replication initiation protein RepC